jgi:hypothetical protein
LNSACAGYQNYLDLGQSYLPQPSVSAENIDLGLNNSGYPAQPHPIIVNNLRQITFHFIIYYYKNVLFYCIQGGGVACGEVSET